MVFPFVVVVFAPVVTVVGVTGAVVPAPVVAVEPAIFEGFDSYQVEIDGLDGKSYDAFVSLDGEVLGYDQWDYDDTAEIEAEAAELAL